MEKPVAMNAGHEHVGAAPQRALVQRPSTAAVFSLDRWPILDGPLCGLVDHLWQVHWERSVADPVDTMVLPYPAVNLTIETGNDGESRHDTALPEVLVHGVVTSAFRTTLRGSGSVFGLRFAPGAFAAAFGCDASSITDTVVTVREFFDRHMANEIMTAASPGDPADTAARDAVCDIVAQRVGPTAPEFEWLAGLLAAMRDDRSLRRVEQLPAICGWSTRTIERAFRRFVGVTPKWVLSRYRLQEAVLELELDPTIDLTTLAHRHGWYDQAHFGNEFRRTLGCTPAEYAAASRAVAAVGQPATGSSF